MFEYAVYVLLLAVFLAVIFLEQITYLDGLSLVFSVLGTFFVVGSILDEGGIASQFKKSTDEKRSLKQSLIAALATLVFSGGFLWGGISFLADPCAVYLSRYGAVHNWSGGILLLLIGLFIPVLWVWKFIAQRFSK